jgi:hypothetical protein
MENKKTQELDHDQSISAALCFADNHASSKTLPFADFGQGCEIGGTETQGSPALRANPGLNDGIPLGFRLRSRPFAVGLMVAVPAAQDGVAGAGKKKRQRRRFNVTVAKYHVGFASNGVA